MTDKEKAELTYKTLDFIKGMVDDPAVQCEILLNANSMIQNHLSTEALRALITGLFSK